MRAVTIPAHHLAAVILHFRWVECMLAPRRAHESDNKAVQVVYRINGQPRSQSLQTGGARLSVHARAACA
jgi:hypothetical protein